MPPGRRIGDHTLRDRHTDRRMPRDRRIGGRMPRDRRTARRMVGARVTIARRPFMQVTPVITEVAPVITEATPVITEATAAGVQGCTMERALVRTVPASDLVARPRGRAVATDTAEAMDTGAVIRVGGDLASPLTVGVNLDRTPVRQPTEAMKLAIGAQIRPCMQGAIPDGGVLGCTRHTTAARRRITRDRTVEHRRITRDRTVEHRRITRDRTVEHRRIMRRRITRGRTVEHHRIMRRRTTRGRTVEHHRIMRRRITRGRTVEHHRIMRRRITRRRRVRRPRIMRAPAHRLRRIGDRDLTNLRARSETLTGVRANRRKRGDCVRAQERRPQTVARPTRRPGRNSQRFFRRCAPPRYPGCGLMVAAALRGYWPGGYRPSG